MKKTAIILVLVVVFGVFAGLMIAASNSNPIYVQADEIKLDESKNYAEDIWVNVEKYPFLADQGMFIITGYDVEGIPIQISLNDEKAIDAYDVNKPTFIMTHGVQFNGGRYGQVLHMSEQHDFSQFSWPKELFEEEFTGDQLEMSRIYKARGYNVIYGHYERFAESEDTNLGGMNINLNVIRPERNLLTKTHGVLAMKEDGSWTDDDAVIGGSMAELLAADYTRFVNKLPKSAAEQEIHFAGHSMGGFATVLLTQIVLELERVGQIPKGFSPSRVTLLDPYVGFGEVSLDYEAEVAWSGKKYIDGNTRKIVWACLENFAYNDIAVEYQANLGNGPLTLYGLNSLYDNDVGELYPLVAYVRVTPDYGYDSVPINGHNVMRDWYFFNSTEKVPLAYLDDGTTMEALSAAVSTERVKSLRGWAFVLGTSLEEEGNGSTAEGQKTLYAGDDKYFVMSHYDFADYVPKYGKLI